MRRGLVAFVVFGALACLQPLAYADPPDPTWIAGFWDDADFDAAVVLITSSSGVAEAHSLRALEPHWAPISPPPLTDDRLAPSPAGPQRQCRASPGAPA